MATNQEVIQVSLQYKEAAQAFLDMANKVKEFENALNSSGKELDDFKSKMSKGAGDIKSAMNGVAEAEKTIARVPNGLEKIGSAFSTIAEEGSKLANKMIYLGASITASISIPLQRFGKDTMDIFLSVDKEYTSMAKATGMTTDELRLTFDDAAESISEKFGVAKDVVLNTLTEFSKAGVQTREDLLKLTEMSAKASINFDTDLNTATEGVLQTMKQWGYTVDETSVALSIMNEIADNTATSELDLMNAFTIASPSARAFGVDIGTLGGLIAALQSRGYEAGETGNSLKTIFNYLAQDTVKLSDALEAMGVNMSPEKLNMLSGRDKILVLADAYSKFKDQIGVTDEQMLQWASTVETSDEAYQEYLGSLNNVSGALSDLVRMRQFPKFAAMLDDVSNAMDEDVGTYSEFEKAMGSIGFSAEELSAIYDGKLGVALDSASVKWDIYNAKMTNVKESVGGLVMEALMPILENVTEMIGKFNELDPRLQQVIVQFGLFLAVAGPIILILGSIIKAVSELSGAFGAVSTFIGTNVVPILSTLAGPLILIGTVIAGVIYWIVEIGKKFKENFIDKIKPETIDKIKEAITGFVGGVKEGLGLINTENVEESWMELVAGWLQDMAERINEIDWDKVTEIAKKVGIVVGAIGSIIVAIVKFIGWVALIPVWLGMASTSIKEWAEETWNKFLEWRENAVDTIIGFVTETWNKFLEWRQNVIDTIVGFVTETWNKFMEWRQKSIDTIVGFVVDSFNKIVEWRQKIIDTVVGFVVDFYNKIVAWKNSVVSKFVEMVVNIRDKMVELWERIKEIWDNIKKSISEKVSELKETVKSKWDEAMQPIKDTIAKALGWGKDLIKNFIQGIKDQVGDLTKELDSVAQKIKNKVGFSVPKEGPLSDADTYMPDFMNLMAEGLKGSLPRVMEQVDVIAGLIQSAFNPQLMLAGAGTMSVTPTMGDTTSFMANMDRLATPIEASSPTQVLNEVHTHYEVKPGVMIASEAEQREFVRQIQRIQNTEDIRLATEV